MESANGIPVEAEKSLDNQFVSIIEGVLCVEPLLEKPEWFDEDNPVVLTKEMLESVPGISKEAVARYEQKKETFINDRDPDKRVIEVMNPFRANLLTAILSPTKSIIDRNLNTLGESKVQIQENVKKIFGIVADKKVIGQQMADFQELVKNEETADTPDLGKIEEYKTTIESMKKDSRLTREEVNFVYQLGKLAVEIVRKKSGLDQKYGDIGELVNRVSLPIEEIKTVE